MGVYMAQMPKFFIQKDGMNTNYDIHRCNNLVFGAGTSLHWPAGELYYEVSLSEIYKMVPLLIHKFDFGLVDPSKDWTTHDFLFNKQSGIRVKFKYITAAPPRPSL
ncbi:Cytochrome P450 E-class group I [Penicillium vulpinum]|uniref:Cytochrome P450 E-class group I n=1 Tax=Penicillium vulpinum TaxID=29845 RepID=UPI002549885C|nr:Cytochrome P450 E-class group I [Penicillium vulpinum]KAJ5958644.1 Cytochrome P450 E-class group I [Penicillium vulpinum]